MTLIDGVLARVFVDDIDLALPTYQALTGDEEPQRFRFREVELARIGSFLLLRVPPERRADYERVATVLVNDLDQVAAIVEQNQGTVLEGPAPAPNGPRLIARHADGAVFEYIQPVG